MALPGPAYKSAACSRSSPVGVPVFVMWTPGSSGCQGPPTRTLCSSPCLLIPQSLAWPRVITPF
jgi:hypothetical protein